MQGLGILSFIACIACMYGIYLEKPLVAEICFAVSLLFFAISLLISFVEIQFSNKALELELSDMEREGDKSIVGYFKKKRGDNKFPEES